MTLHIKNRTIVKLLLLSVSMVSIMCTGAISPALPYIAKHYSYLADARLMTRLVVTTPHLVICILSIPIGWLLEKMDRILAMVFAISIYVFVGSGCFFLENIKYIILLRALLGVCIAVVLSASSTLIQDLFTGKERRMTVGLQTTFMSIGTISFNLLSGFITDTVSWRYNFLLYFIPAIFIPLLLIYLYPLDISLKCRSKSTEHKKTKNAKTETGDGKQNNYLICIILFLVTFNMMIYYMIPLQLPFLLKTFPNINASKISIAFGIETLASAMFASVYRRISDKFPGTTSQLSAIALISMGACYYFLSHISSYYGALILMPIYGFGMGMMMPNTTMWLMNSTSLKNKGIVIGAYYAATYLGKFSCSLWLDFLKKILHINDMKAGYGIASKCLFVIGLVIILISHISHKDKQTKIKKAI